MRTLRTLGIACGATRRRLRRYDDRLESAVAGGGAVSVLMKQSACTQRCNHAPILPILPILLILLILLIRAHQSSSELIRAHQSSSELIRTHQNSSAPGRAATISASHQRPSSAAINGPPSGELWTFTDLQGTQFELDRRLD